MSYVVQHIKYWMWFVVAACLVIVDTSIRQPVIQNTKGTMLQIVVQQYTAEQTVTVFFSTIETMDCLAGSAMWNITCIELNDVFVL